MADINVTYLPQVWLYFLTRGARHHISGSWGLLPSPETCVKSQLWDTVSLIFNKQYWSSVQPTASIIAYFPIDFNFSGVFAQIFNNQIANSPLCTLYRWMLWKSRWPLCFFETHDHLLMISRFSNLYACNRWGRRTHPGKMETLQFYHVPVVGVRLTHHQRVVGVFFNRFFKSSRALFVYRTWFAEQASWAGFALHRQTDAHCQNTMNHTNDGVKKSHKDFH